MKEVDLLAILRLTNEGIRFTLKNWDTKFFESTRGRIVVLLRRSGRTVEELARALGLTDNGVRAHLAVLERDGIAAAAGIGTPWQRRRQAGLRLRADIGGRGAVPEGLRTGARPAPGCSGRAAWA